MVAVSWVVVVAVVSWVVVVAVVAVAGAGWGPVVVVVVAGGRRGQC